MTSKTLSLAMAVILSTNLMSAPLAQAGPLETTVRTIGPVAPAISGLMDEEDHSLREAGCTAAVTAGTAGVAVGTAASAGAGTLAGYAGMASTVSSLGLGPVTTFVAGAMGSSATGAAATTMVVSAVGGPVIFAGILAAGTAYGLYKGARYLRDRLR